MLLFAGLLSSFALAQDATAIQQGFNQSLEATLQEALTASVTADGTCIATWPSCNVCVGLDGTTISATSQSDSGGQCSATATGPNGSSITYTVESSTIEGSLSLISTKRPFNDYEVDLSGSREASIAIVVQDRTGAVIKTTTLSANAELSGYAEVYDLDLDEYSDETYLGSFDIDVYYGGYAGVQWNADVVGTYTDELGGIISGTVTNDLGLDCSISGTYGAGDVDTTLTCR